LNLIILSDVESFALNLDLVW